MAYTLTPDLLTGNATIDAQHRQLIQAINDLLAACSEGRGRTELTKTTQFLYDYTSRHFADEEKLQMQSHYPDYPNHHQYHETFKKTVKDIMTRLEAQGPSISLVSEVNTAIGGWLLNHIKREDVKVAAHIRANTH